MKMDYIELDVKVQPRQPGSDLLISALAEKGFESFADTSDGFQAYIPATDFSDDLLAVFQQVDPGYGEISVTQQLIPYRNWNEEWEKQFEPVWIGGRCLVRAPFHPAVPGAEFELIIQPQQSFGTGHHATTRLMLEKLLTMPADGRYILDMGCGTGVLSVLAAKLGAREVTGIDIESGAVENARENIARNAVTGVSIEQGDEQLVAGRKFDMILANINRNVLLKAMPVYAAALAENGKLLLSGFFLQDVQVLVECAAQNGLIHQSTENDGEWALLHFNKS